MADGVDGREQPSQGRKHQNLKEAHMSDLPSRVGSTVMFLRMTEKEIRKLAEQTPDIARELGQIAEQLQVEADSLTGHVSELRLR